jgi:heme A synthase
VWNGIIEGSIVMAGSVHAASALLYGPLLGYALLAVAAGVYAVLHRPLPGWYWTLALLALALVAVQGAAGLLVVLGGTQPSRGLHLLYGLLAVAAGAIVYSLRPGGYLRRAFVRESGWGEARTLALIAFTEAALILRAWMTGVGTR